MSNKTPEKPAKKTESAPRRSPLHLLIAISLVILGGYLLLSGINNVTDNKSILITPNGKRLNIEIADDQTERQQGLSGRDSLPTNGAMLFKFEQASENLCFWMKDMKFSLDMVWLNEDKKVVTIHRDVKPETYPSSFCPDSAAQYVIEIPAGTSDDYGLEIDRQVRF